MKLLVIAASTNDDVAIKEKLATYKYKEDVLLLQDISEIDVAKLLLLLMPLLMHH